MIHRIQRKFQLGDELTVRYFDLKFPFTPLNKKHKIGMEKDLLPGTYLKLKINYISAFSHINYI